MTDDNTQAELAALSGEDENNEKAKTALLSEDMTEVAQNDDLNAAELLYREYGVDARDFESDEELRDATLEAGAFEKNRKWS